MVGEIVGFASVNLSGALTWETQSDWDSAVTNNEMFADGGELWLDLGEEDWESGSFPSYWTDEGNATLTVVGSPVFEGSNALQLDQPSATQGERYATRTVKAGQYTSTITFVYREPSSNTQTAIEIASSSGDTLLFVGTDNPQVNLEDGTGSTVLADQATVTPDYDEWRRFDLTFNWGASTYDVTWTDETGSTPQQSASGRSFKTATTEDIETISITFGGDDGGLWGGAAIDSYVDPITAVYAASGNLVTATKTFTNSEQPGLDNLDYSLNGEGITVDVIGSPGTGSEETVSQILDGASQYGLSWSASHTNFRLDIQMTSSDGGETPVVNSLTLS